MLSRLTQLFQKRTIPEEARDLFKRSTSIRELVKGLDRLKTENELELNQLKDEVLVLEQEEQDLISQLKQGIEGRRKKFVLQNIQRLRKQMDNMDRRIGIYDQNILLHLTLMGKILDMEAMEQKGVEEAKIEEILLDFDATLEQYLENQLEGTESTASQVFKAEQERELSALEQEILAQPSHSLDSEPPPLEKKKSLTPKKSAELLEE
jgi:hypothetical protein